MENNGIEYIIHLNTDQAHEVLKAVELLMRLKLGQYQEIVYDLCDIRNPMLAERVSEVDTMLKHAFSVMNSQKKPSEYKDTEWYRLYNIYQVLRKTIHDAETPDKPGLDAQDPIQLSTEPLPVMKWETK